MGSIASIERSNGVQMAQNNVCPFVYSDWIRCQCIWICALYSQIIIVRHCKIIKLNQDDSDCELNNDYENFLLQQTNTHTQFSHICIQTSFVSANFWMRSIVISTNQNPAICVQRKFFSFGFSDWILSGAINTWHIIMCCIVFSYKYNYPPPWQ